MLKFNQLSEKISYTEMILRTGTRKKILDFDFCPHREYLLAVSRKVESFQ